MSFNDAATTQAEIERAEQQKIDSANNQHQLNDAGFVPDFEPQVPPVEEEGDKEDTNPKSMREQKTDEVLEIHKERRNREREASQASLSKPPQPETTPEPAAEDNVDLKVRKQSVRMTIKDRDNLLLEEHDQSEIDGMSQAERNKFAQMILGVRQYGEEIAERKGRISDISAQESQNQGYQPAQPAAQAQTQGQPAEQPKPEPTALELAQEAVREATKAMEFGEEGAAEQFTEATQKLAEAIADVRVEERLSTEQAQRVEAVIENEFAVGKQESDRMINEVSEDILKNPMNNRNFEYYVAGGYKRFIAAAIDKVSPAQQENFIKAGITPDALYHMEPRDAEALYKDMIRKGYQVPKPSHVRIAVATEFVSQLKSGATQPDTQPNTQASEGDPNPQPVDRSDRKARIQNQPGRASVPKAGNPGKPPKKTPQQRAAEARAKQAKMRSEGIPVQR